MADNDLSNHELFQSGENAPPANAPTVEDNEAEVTSTPTRDPDGKFASNDEEPAQGADEDETLEASEPVDEDDADTGESDDAESKEEAEDKSQRRRTARERISQLTAQKREAEARAEQAERQFRQLQEALGQDIDPNLEFEDPAKYTQDSVKRALSEQKATDAAEQARQAYEAKLKSSVDMFQTRLETMRDEMPDFDQAFTPQTPISDVAVEFLGDSEVGPKIAYHWGKNPSLAHRIAAMNPVAQGIELARLEAKLSTPPPKRTTKAPKPARPIQQSGSSGTFDVQTASVADLQRRIYGG